jgi:hypothetical protein
MILRGRRSPRTDLNRQPADYKSAALPLSYVGVNKRHKILHASYYLYPLTYHIITTFSSTNQSILMPM